MTALRIGIILGVLVGCARESCINGYIHRDNGSSWVRDPFERKCVPKALKHEGE